MGMEPMKRYVIDTNALSFLREKRRKCGYFKKNCFIPELVLDEAKGFPDHTTLTSQKITVNASILSFVQEIMDQVNYRDRSLVNLYKNQGAADPFVLATAMYQREAQNKQLVLLPIEWVVVSDDKAVRKTASTFNFPCISAKELAEVIDDNLCLN